MNFDKYKFRPSQLPLLMTKPKLKSEALSGTAKSILDDIFIKEVYGREKIITSKYLEKGTNQESESISLYRKVKQVFVAKNEQKLENDYLAGTPDLILEDKIVDVKTNWDIWTFHQVDEAKAKKDYYYQLVAYMILTKKTKAELAYCLISNDDYTIISELQKIKYSKGLKDESPELEEYEEQITKNNKYEDIEQSKRLKVFSFELDKEEEERIINTLKECRKYLNNLSL